MAAAIIVGAAVSGMMSLLCVMLRLLERIEETAVAAESTPNPITEWAAYQAHMQARRCLGTVLIQPTGAAKLGWKLGRRMAHAARQGDMLACWSRVAALAAFVSLLTAYVIWPAFR